MDIPWTPDNYRLLCDKFGITWTQFGEDRWRRACEEGKELAMDETLRKLDELALELKLLTTEMREKGPLRLKLAQFDVKLYEARLEAGKLRPY